jgi:hypothetical protein
MTAGYYKNHVDYNKHVSYGRSVSYGRHINYNKPSDGDCNFTTYFDGSGNFNIDFVRRAPLNFVDSTPVDTLKAISINYDPSLGDDFDIDVYLTDTPNDDTFFVLFDSLNSARRIFGRTSFGNARYRVQAASLLTPLVTSDFVTPVNAGERHKYGFSIDPILKTICGTIDGIKTLDDESIDFTGTIFNTLVIGSNELEVGGVDMLLYACNSTLLGNISFVSNVSDGQSFTNAEGTTFVINDEIPLNIQYPDYTPTDPNDITKPAPRLGDIYNDALLIGNRDLLTGEFTPDAGTPTAELVSDTPCADNNLILVDGIAITDENGFAHEVE